MTYATMDDIIAEISKSLCYGRVRNNEIFVSVATSYPNGVGVTVRIRPSVGGMFVVSDDGYAALIAQDMHALSIFSRIAAGVATRNGVNFEKGNFFVEEVECETLPAVVTAVANASARAMERVVAALERPRLRRSREIFDKRLVEAFGKLVVFNPQIIGATGHSWEFSAGIERVGEIVRLFELVAPTTQSVAIANMKISDTLALGTAPTITAALLDYERTDPTLRSILSAAGGSVIAANDDIGKYNLAS